mmetsp:Transcript_75439/g.157299  ORF Transcript_75439/g.157299 Transcript_75439/m.157299 type:complete len:226 (-) Transcript_75439:894-1571(-)
MALLPVVLVLLASRIIFAVPVAAVTGDVSPEGVVFACVREFSNRGLLGHLEDSVVGLLQQHPLGATVQALVDVALANAHHGCNRLGIARTAGALVVHVDLLVAILVAGVPSFRHVAALDISVAHTGSVTRAEMAEGEKIFPPGQFDVRGVRLDVAQPVSAHEQTGRFLRVGHDAAHILFGIGDHQLFHACAGLGPAADALHGDFHSRLGRVASRGGRLQVQQHVH